MSTNVSRLAPSPTGALHLGNARTFLMNWSMARNRGWRLLMRIEDLDGPRIKPGAAAQALDDLAWLGIDYDGQVITQSDDLEPYRQVMHQLAAAGRIYPCALSRSEIEQAASAPHQGEHELRFPPQLRPDGLALGGTVAFDDEQTNYRLVTPERAIEIRDELAGHHIFQPQREVGDFVVWTRRAQPSYQLAVVVDDHRQGVTDVVRGLDLLPSAARQTLLYEALGWQPPRWWHVPLVVGPDGRRLAKRHGDTRIAQYRERGVTAQRVIGLMAWWSGVTDQRRELTAEAFRSGFDPARLSTRPIIFTEEDERWLCG